MVRVRVFWALAQVQSRSSRSRVSKVGVFALIVLLLSVFMAKAQDWNALNNPLPQPLPNRLRLGRGARAAAATAFAEWRVTIIFYYLLVSFVGAIIFKAKY
jgi:hypothetical protein